jgi:hypothetical protein
MAAMSSQFPKNLSCCGIGAKSRHLLLGLREHYPKFPNSPNRRPLAMAMRRYVLYRTDDSRLIKLALSGAPRVYQDEPRGLD